MRFELLAVPAVLMVVLVWGYRRESRRRLRWQQSLLDCAVAPLEACRKQLAQDGMPVLRGRCADALVEIRLIRDDVTVRKLPCLWLALSLRTPLPGCPTIDIVARMRGTEFYAALSSLEHRLESLPQWPEELTIKSTSADASLAPLDEQVRDFFLDPLAKEMLITPRGVRLVYQLAQARRAEYLVLRAGHFDAEPAPAQLLQALLSRALGVVRTLKPHESAAHSNQSAA